MTQKVNKIINKINRNALTNNTQRVLLSLLKPSTKDGWVARTAIRVPSATARIRELRSDEFGKFVVECVPAEVMKTKNPKRCVRSSVTDRQTFYRVCPDSVTVSGLRKAFKGVI